MRKQLFSIFFLCLKKRNISKKLSFKILIFFLISDHFHTKINPTIFEQLLNNFNENYTNNSSKYDKYMLENERFVTKLFSKKFL